MIYLAQYRIVNISYDVVPEEMAEALRTAIAEPIAPTNGLEDEDVTVTLSQGSLVVDARIAMPSEAGRPVLPEDELWLE